MYILDTIDFGSVAGGESSVGAYLACACSNMSKYRSFDPYQRANHGFWNSWWHLNQDVGMFAGNLELIMEVMLSQLMWCFGRNESWTLYFQVCVFKRCTWSGVVLKVCVLVCTQLVMVAAGAGHFRRVLQGGQTVAVNEKPNTTGMDWSMLRLRDLFALVLKRAGVFVCTGGGKGETHGAPSLNAGIHDPEKNLQGPMQCASWTDRALELATCVTLVAGKGRSREVQSLPSQRQGFMSIAVPERRGMGSDLNAFIRVISRGEAYSTVNYNTADPNGTNVRQQMERVRVTDAHICTLSSNVPADKPDSAEKYQTLAVVSEVKVPGAPLMRAQGVKRKLNNFSTNAFGRHRPIEGTKKVDNVMIGNVLPYSHIFTLVHMALPNKTGLCPVRFFV